MLIPTSTTLLGLPKVTRSGRLFSPDIAPPAARRPVVISPASVPTSIPDQVLSPTPVAESSNARGKGITTDVPAQTEAPKMIIVEASKQEMKEILKIIKSDFNVVE